MTSRSPKYVAATGIPQRQQELTKIRASQIILTIVTINAWNRIMVSLQTEPE
ncbi:MAG: hypothetical protein ABUL46_05600 [Chitinophaga rupis]